MGRAAANLKTNPHTYSSSLQILNKPSGEVVSLDHPALLHIPTATTQLLPGFSISEQPAHHLPVSPCIDCHRSVRSNLLRCTTSSPTCNPKSISTSTSPSYDRWTKPSHCFISRACCNPLSRCLIRRKRFTTEGSIYHKYFPSTRQYVESREEREECDQGVLNRSSQGSKWLVVSKPLDPT